MFFIDPISSLFAVAGSFLYHAGKSAMENSSANALREKWRREWEEHEAQRERERLDTIPKPPVSVSFSDDNSAYIIIQNGVMLPSVKRFTSNNTIFSYSQDHNGYHARIDNMRMGRSQVVSADTPLEIAGKIEDIFEKWSSGDPGIKYSYTG